jgi:hypothetical protein
VDGAGIDIVVAAGVEVVEEVCGSAIRRQLGPWIARYHPHEIVRSARALGLVDPAALARALAGTFALDEALAEELARRSRD